MERLFSPCTRYRRLGEFEGDEFLQALNLDVSTEEFLSAERALTYADLYAMLGNGETVAWLTPHAAVARADGTVEHFWRELGGSCRFYFSADGEGIVALALSRQHLLEIYDVVLRLLASSVVHSVIIRHDYQRSGDISINATCLAYLMEKCQSLRTLTLKLLSLDENHCRVLGTHSRPNLEIVLSSCKLTSTGTNALVEVLRRNQGPTGLHCCSVDYYILADGLRGNSRLKSLVRQSLGRPHSNRPGDDSREILALASALRENIGLVELNLCNVSGVSDEMWDAIFGSLKTHPTLQVLHLWSSLTLGVAPLPPTVLKSRIQALVDMLKVNMTIHTLHLLERYYTDHTLYRETAIPHLETNRLRPHVRAIQKTRPSAYRIKVLGRALVAFRTDSNAFWMLLSGNAEVAFPSRATTIAAAANLPTPGTTAATSSVVAVAASAISALTTTTTGSVPTATAATARSTATPCSASTSDPAGAATVATSSTDKKRKARS
jgi:hypothetical protein